MAGVSAKIHRCEAIAEFVLVSLGEFAAQEGSGI